MPECLPSECCEGDNTLSYEITPSSTVYLRTEVRPGDGGVTAGDGNYSIGDSVTVNATPSIPTSVDVGVDMVWVVDESGLGVSTRVLMNTILPGMDAMLQALGVGSGTVANRYALVGHASGSGGTHGGVNFVAHTHVALGEFAPFLAAISDIATIPGGGSVEDAYEALSYTASNMVWRETSRVAKIAVFISDEDRNIHRYTTGGVTQAEQYAAIKAEMVAAGLYLVGIISNCTPQDGLGNTIMGFKVDPDKTWRMDGLGGYTNGTGGVLTTEGDFDLTFPTGTRTEYGNLVIDPEINGDFWDFEAFRVGIGTCDTNGAVVTRVSGNSFPFAGAIAGEPMSINYVDYTILSVDSGDQVTLTGDAGVQTGVDWSVPRLERDSFLAGFTDAIAESISDLISWNFIGWYNEGGELVSTNISHTFTILNNTVLQARFEHDAE